MYSHSFAKYDVVSTNTLLRRFCGTLEALYLCWLHLGSACHPDCEYRGLSPKDADQVWRAARQVLLLQKHYCRRLVWIGAIEGWF